MLVEFQCNDANRTVRLIAGIVHRANVDRAGSDRHPPGEVVLVDGDPKLDIT